MRYLGVDPGEKRIGLAISDPDGTIAVPLRVIETSGSQGIANVAAIAQSEAVDAIVVGLPLSLDGSQGPQAKRALRFGRRLATSSGLAVVFWDESFSSVEADRRMIDAGLSRRHRDRRRDAAAAAIMLQDYLDGRRSRLNADARE